MDDLTAVNSAVPPDLLRLLRCPATGQPLAVADAVTLERVTAAQAPPSGRLTAALLREDQKVLYPIRDGIPVLLAEEAIPLP